MIQHGPGKTDDGRCRVAFDRLARGLATVTVIAFEDCPINRCLRRRPRKVFESQLRVIANSTRRHGLPSPAVVERVTHRLARRDRLAQGGGFGGGGIASDKQIAGRDRIDNANGVNSRQFDDRRFAFKGIGSQRTGSPSYASWACNFETKARVTIGGPRWR